MTQLEEVPPPTDDDAEDPDQAARPPLPSIGRINAVLGQWYRLQHDVDAYDALHKSEIERLKRRREQAVGPTERRIARIRNWVELFAVETYLSFGSLGHRVPNGDITSRPVVHTIEKDDAEVYTWLADIAELADAWELRPWVDLKKLRAWLDKQVDAGYLERMVTRAVLSDEPEFWSVDESKGWKEPFEPGMVGVWFWTVEGAEHYLADVEVTGEVLRGVTWEPNGTMGSGRNFKIKL